MPEEEKLTQEELMELFGPEIPAPVMSLLWNSPPEETIGAVRRRILAFSRGLKTERNPKFALYSDTQVLVLQLALAELNEKATAGSWPVKHPRVSYDSLKGLVTLLAEVRGESGARGLF